MVRKILMIMLVVLLSAGSVWSLESKDIEEYTAWGNDEEIVSGEEYDDDFLLLPAEPLPASTMYTYSQLVTRLEALANTNPDIVKLVIQGKSVDNRNVYAITLGTGPKQILITGAQHAREWITTPVLVETIAAYIQDYRNGAVVSGEPVKHMLNQYSITFIPMANPDGVTLAQFGADAFPARKSALLSMNLSSWRSDFRNWKANIRGVDLNRNYNVVWTNPKTTPISHKPYYAYYKGPNPESEPEAKAIANWVRTNRPKLLLDYHASGEYFFWYFNQTGAALERDRKITRAMVTYSGFGMEPVNPSKISSSNLNRWASMVMQIPSICVEVGTSPSYNLTMDKMLGIFAKTKYLPLVATMNLPDYQRYVPVKSVSLSSVHMYTIPGSHDKLTATVLPVNASIKKINWSSSNTQVASVDHDGSITAHSLGTTTITGTTDDKNISAFCTVTVYPTLPRLKGANRYETAIEISQAGWQQSESVILARGDDFADGLAGIPLAHLLGAPILLTSSETLNPSTKAEILRLGAQKIVLLGGTAAISAAVADTLSLEMSLDVERMGGENRFETAVTIARELVGAETAVIVLGHNFPDALSVAAYAAMNGYPILLTATDILSPETLAYIMEAGITSTLVIGGNSVVSEAVFEQLPQPHRISGASRYDTGVAIDRYFNNQQTTRFAATGRHFADALAGAALAAKHGTGILLVANYVPQGVSSYISENPITSVTLLGGIGAIPSSVEANLSRLLQQSPSNDASE